MPEFSPGLWNLRLPIAGPLVRGGLAGGGPAETGTLAAAFLGDWPELFVPAQSTSVLNSVTLAPVLGLGLLGVGLGLLLSVAGPLIWNRDRTVSRLRSVAGLGWWMATAWIFYQLTLVLPGREVMTEGGPRAVASNSSSAPLASAVTDRERVETEPMGHPVSVRVQKVSSPAEEPAAGSAGASPGAASPPQSIAPSSPVGSTHPAIRIRNVVRDPPPWSAAEVSPDADPQEGVFRSAPSASRARALDEVLARARVWVGERFEHELPGPLRISDELLDRHAIEDLVIEEFARSVELPGGGREEVTMSVAHLRLRFQPKLRLAVYAEHREQLARGRLIPVAGGVLGLSLLLGTIAGGLRLDQLTHGKRRMRLLAGVACVLAATGTGVWMLAREMLG